ncbi:MAG: DMT family transporter [Xanthobacteraceae bacterium]|jgi:drug/metabolite transporter (DMT)-like permease
MRVLERLYRWPRLLLILSAILWAGNVIAGRLAVDQISPLTLVFVRWVMVLGVLWPLYGAEVRMHWPRVRERMFSIVLMGICGFTGFNALFYYAAHYATAVELGILQGALPMFVLIGAFAAHRTRPSYRQLLGVFITAVAVVLVATGGKPQAILDLQFNRGALAMIVASMFYAFYTVALRDRPEMPSLPFFTLLAVIAAATSVPLILLEAITTGLWMPTLQGWLVTAFIAILPSFVAQVFYIRGIDVLGPARGGIYLNLVPVLAALFAVALLHEPFESFHALALALVIAGIWLAERLPSLRRQAG